MTVSAVPEEVSAAGNGSWDPGKYLFDLNKTAIYAATRGMPLMLPGHTAFLVTFVEAWLKKEPQSARVAATALFGRWPRWIQRRIASWLGSPRISNRLVLLVLLVPFVLPLIVLVPWETARSVLNSSWDVFRKGVRMVPPLITAMVVVFVTGDAWRILGSGSTLRVVILIAMFIVAGVLFLVRFNCWDDLDADPKQAEKLLEGIKHRRPAGFQDFVSHGVPAAPIQRPRGFGQAWVYLGYWLLCTFALIVTAAFVSAALILIGVILITRGETVTLASTVHVYQTFPGGNVITKQLLQLSFSLGAFAAFFLVAAQKPGDRRGYMRNVLLRYRRVLLVYSIYRGARRQAIEWTDVPCKRA